MAQLLKLKRSSVSGKVPTTSNLEAGELAINTADGKIFFERDDSTVQGIFTTNALTTGSLRQSGSDSYFLSNVGIKTTSPSRALEVRGMIVISGSYENLSDPSYAGLLFSNPQSNGTGLIRQQDSGGGLILSSTECIIIKPNAAATHTGVNTAVFCTGSTTFNTDVRIPDNNLHITGSIFLSGSMLTNVIGSSTSPVGGVFVGGESEEGITFVTGTTSSLYTDSEGLVFAGEPLAYATGSAGYLAVFETQRKVTGSAVFQNNGSIGIGNTSPGAKLDITGDLKVGTISAATTDTDTFLVSDSGLVKSRTGAQVLSDIGAQPAGNYVIDNGGAAGQLGVWSSGTELSGSNGLYWSGANLGIGTTSPSEKLTVQGNISASGNLDVDGSITGSSLQIAGINYPTIDGTLNQAIVTDGAGNLSFGSVAAASATNTIIAVKNVSGGTIEKGTPLYVTGSGTSGNVAGVWPADAGNRLRMPALAVAGEQLLDGAEGVGLLDGFISGVDTSLFQSGDEVFVAVGGGYTNVAPTGSGVLIQKLGNVEKVHASNGSGVINGPNAVRSLPNWETGKVMVGSPTYPVTSSFTYFDESNARLGIGTTSPSYKLDVETADDIVASFVSTDNKAAIRINDDDTSVYVSAENSKASFGFNVGVNAGNLNVDSAGNVGIGTASPGTKLDVNGSARIASNLTVSDSSTVASYIYLISSASGESELRMGDTDTDAGSIAYNNASDTMKLRTGGADRVYIDSTGNVGIGATSPSKKLHIVGDVLIEEASPSIQLTDTTNNADGSIYLLDDGTMVLSADANNEQAGSKLLFYVDGTEKGRIDSNGTLQVTGGIISGDLTVGGIVTAQEFHTEFVSASIVYSSGSTKFGDTSDDKHAFTGSIQINYPAGGTPNLLTLYGNRNSNDTEVGILFKDRNIVAGGQEAARIYSQRQGSGGDFDLVFATSDAGGTDTLGEAMRIDHVGNVGIGTTSPSYALDIERTTGEVAIQLQARDNSSNTAIYFGDNNDADVGSLIYNQGSNYMSFTTNTGERMRITSAGNVGIGTTSPSTLLDVRGEVSVAYNALYGLRFYNHVRNNWSFIGNDVSGSSSANLRFGDATGEVMRITGGSVGIGTASPGSKLHVSGSARINGTIYSGDGSISANNSLQLQYDAASGDGVLSALSTGGNTTLALQTANSGTTATKLYLSSGGSVRLNFYGSGTFTGTPTYGLSVDSSGNIIETTANIDGSGAANQVTYWVDNNTITGSGDFTWDGSTLTVNGTIEAVEKSFVIDHPLYDDKKLVYGVLEGPEHAVYCRGKINGEVIELPEEWTGLVHEDSITVQLTPIGRHQNLYVVDVRDNRVFIKNGDLLTSKINAFYYIQGTRKDVKPLQTLRDK